MCLQHNATLCALVLDGNPGIGRDAERRLTDELETRSVMPEVKGVLLGGGGSRACALCCVLSMLHRVLEDLLSLGLDWLRTVDQLRPAHSSIIVRPYARVAAAVNSSRKRTHVCMWAGNGPTSAKVCKSKLSRYFFGTTAQ